MGYETSSPAWEGPGVIRLPAAGGRGGVDFSDRRYLESGSRPLFVEVRRSGVPPTVSNLTTLYAPSERAARTTAAVMTMQRAAEYDEESTPLAASLRRLSTGNGFRNAETYKAAIASAAAAAATAATVAAAAAPAPSTAARSVAAPSLSTEPPHTPPSSTSSFTAGVSSHSASSAGAAGEGQLAELSNGCSCVVVDGVSISKFQSLVSWGQRLHLTRVQGEWGPTRTRPLGCITSVRFGTDMDPGLPRPAISVIQYDDEIPVGAHPRSSSGVFLFQAPPGFAISAFHGRKGWSLDALGVFMAAAVPRTWDPDSHKEYPEDFKDGVRTLLLAHNRLRKLHQGAARNGPKSGAAPAAAPKAPAGPTPWPAPGPSSGASHAPHDEARPAPSSGQGEGHHEEAAASAGLGRLPASVLLLVVQQLNQLSYHKFERVEEAGYTPVAWETQRLEAVDGNEAAALVQALPSPGGFLSAPKAAAAKAGPMSGQEPSPLASQGSQGLPQQPHRQQSLPPPPQQQQLLQGGPKAKPGKERRKSKGPGGVLKRLLADVKQAMGISSGAKDKGAKSGKVAKQSSMKESKTKGMQASRLNRSLT